MACTPKLNFKTAYYTCTSPKAMFIGQIKDGPVVQMCELSLFFFSSSLFTRSIWLLILCLSFSVIYLLRNICVHFEVLRMMLRNVCLEQLLVSYELKRFLKTHLYDKENFFLSIHSWKVYWTIRPWNKKIT